MCFECRKPSHIKTKFLLLNKNTCKKKKKEMCTIWKKIDKIEIKQDSDEESESIICFMPLSKEVTMLNLIWLLH